MTEEALNTTDSKISNYQTVDMDGQDLNVAKEPNLFNTKSDILENDILNISEKLLANLLKDHTKAQSLKSQKKDDFANWPHIIWATNDYKDQNHDFFDEIREEDVTGDKGFTIRPRALKERDVQAQRSKDMAEVFTPAWICNTQNNLIDNQWFGREGVFNTEKPDHTWVVNPNKIEFPDKKNWLDYVKDTRMEITCGEAPYLASRYDTTTGELIPLKERIGLLDRKLRVVGENTNTEIEWLSGAFLAVKHIYGYEFQGDNLLLAREAVLFTVMEYFEDKFKKKLQDYSLNALEDFSYIISWNLWQMDGMKLVIPGTCHNTPRIEKKTKNLFGDYSIQVIKEEECEGCKNNHVLKHNGIACIIKDWSNNCDIDPQKLSIASFKSTKLEFKKVYQDSVFGSNTDNNSVTPK